MISQRLQIVLACLVATASAAQNLVPNPGFEAGGRVGCNGATPEQFETAMKEWFLPTRARATIYDIGIKPGCVGYVRKNDFIQPHSGRRMMDLCFRSGSNYRTYLEVALAKELIVGKKYHTEIWVHATEGKACNNIGMYFSEILVSLQYRDEGSLEEGLVAEDVPFMGVSPLTPQVNHAQIVSDTSRWVCLKATFTAITKARYLVIGNFFSDKNTSAQNTRKDAPVKGGVFYRIDDVYVGLTPDER